MQRYVHAYTYRSYMQGERHPHENTVFAVTRCDDCSKDDDDDEDDDDEDADSDDDEDMDMLTVYTCTCEHGDRDSLTAMAV